MISGKFGVVIVLHVCSHIGSFYLPVFFFFHSFVFIIIIIGIIIFQCDCMVPMFCVALILLVYPFAGAGPHGWVVDIAGHGGVVLSARG